MNTALNTAALTVKAPVASTLYVQGELLYAQSGSERRVVAKVGNLGKVEVSGEYPRGAYVGPNMDWTYNTGAVAAYMAVAVNAYPVLRKQVAKLEGSNAEVVAKLGVAKEALKRAAAGKLDQAYVASLVRELEMCLARNK